MNKLFPSSTEKDLWVDKVDYRVHFALNCGAKSCPPIAFYNDEILHQQLNIAMKAYLNSEAEYNREEDVLRLPKIMSWFRADFGGKKGMLALSEAINIIPDDADPKIKFKAYNWKLTLNNYKIKADER